MNGDTTTWTYEVSPPLLLSMTYADNKFVSYNFSPAGRLTLRTWARQPGGQPLTTTYTFDACTGERTGIDYSDTTPDVTFAYKRFGALASAATAGVITHTYTYNARCSPLTTP